MLAEVMTAYGGLKAAAEITQGLLSLKTDAAVSSKVVELNGVIAGVQSDLFGLQAKFAEMDEQSRALKRRLDEAESWEATKARHKPHQFPTGSVAFVSTQEQGNGEVRLFFCANCFYGGKLSPLQPLKRAVIDSMRCHTCDASIETEHRPSQQRTRGVAGSWRTT